MRKLKHIFLGIIEKKGYTLVKNEKVSYVYNPDIKKDHEFIDIYENCQSYTMTSIERMFALYNSVKYVLTNNIEGDFVECGVWKGGSAMLMAMVLARVGKFDRDIFLYDTYSGMTLPGELDVNYLGDSAMSFYNKLKFKDIEEGSNFCYASIEEVKKNMELTGYPLQKIHFIKGKVENTIPNQNHLNSIALLRLDTDWYDSTRHELFHLFPKVSNNGILIIDDYGFWEGSKKAVDEYFSKNKLKFLLQRIDFAGRLVIKNFD